MSNEPKRDVHEVLSEFLKVRAAAQHANDLCAELLSLIGEDDSHDPNKCQWCSMRGYRALGAQR